MGECWLEEERDESWLDEWEELDDVRGVTGTGILDPIGEPK